MSKPDRLVWTIARHVADMPRGTVFAASHCAIAGVRVAQELMGCRLALCGRGGAYDPAGVLSLHARHWLFNQRPRARITLTDVFDTLSEPHALFATPAQVDGEASANLSVIGDHATPKVAFGGSRGLPDARSVHFVLPLHKPRQLVKRVDFVSTAAARREPPALLFTELCVMRWSGARGSWMLEGIAPEIGLDELRGRTGFAFEAHAQPVLLEDPDEAVRACLARVDPLGLRRLDFITDRAEHLETVARIYADEAALVGGSVVPRTPGAAR